jgi:hypothetical protein
MKMPSHYELEALLKRVEGGLTTAKDAHTLRQIFDALAATAAMEVRS